MKMEVDFPDDFLSELLASDFEEIAREALEKSAPVLEKTVKSSCQSVLADKTRTELVDSFKIWNMIVKTKTDAYMLGVSAYGNPEKKTKWSSKQTNGKVRHRTTSNNDIAWWLEHGNAHQAPKPFIDRAAGNAQQKVMSICQEIYNKKVGVE